MQLHGIIVIVAAAVSAALAVPAPASASNDSQVVQAAGVDEVLVLDGTVFYRRGSAWTRVVRGRRATARGVPRRTRASSIGRDRTGRIVVTFTRWPNGEGPVYPRWWVYDVARDTARPLSVPARRLCFASAVALWRTRIAFAESCWKRFRDGDASYEWGLGGRAIALAVRGRVRRADVGDFVEAKLALRGGSLAAVVDKSDPQTLWRIVDDGRWCPREVFSVDAEYDDLGPIAIRHGSVAWGTSDHRWGRFEPRYRHFLLTDVGLAGRCQESPSVRLLDAGIPDRRMRAAGLDVDALYYATERGIHRQPLPRAGSTAPPPNDDFADATPIRAPLPLEMFGRTGYATLQAGEPTFEGSGQTVWYAIRAKRTERLYLDMTYGWAYNVFAGSAVDALTPLLKWSFGTSGECTRELSVQGGQTYWLSVGSGGWTKAPNFRPFVIRISRRAHLPVCTA